MPNYYNYCTCIPIYLFAVPGVLLELGPFMKKSKIASLNVDRLVASLTESVEFLIGALCDGSPLGDLTMYVQQKVSNICALVCSLGLKRARLFGDVDYIVCFFQFRFSVGLVTVSLLREDY